MNIQWNWYWIFSLFYWKNNNFALSGDLYDEQEILSWLLTQKDPAGDVIEALEGEELITLIREEDSLAVYFCKQLSSVSKLYKS